MWGTIIVWKKTEWVGKGKSGSEKRQCITFAPLKGKEMDSGLAFLLEYWWSQHGKVYTHPTLKTLVPPPWYTALKAQEHEISEIIKVHPASASNIDDAEFFTVKFVKPAKDKPTEKIAKAEMNAPIMITKFFTAKNKT